MIFLDFNNVSIINNNPKQQNDLILITQYTNYNSNL